MPMAIIIRLVAVLLGERQVCQQIYLSRSSSLYYLSMISFLISLKATRIAYGGNKEFRRVVTLEGALFEKSGTMSGGGSKPRGGKMGTSIRADTVSREAVASAEKELATMVDKLNAIRKRIVDSVQNYQSLEKAIQHLEMELAKSHKEVKPEFNGY